MSQSNRHSHSAKPERAKPERVVVWRITEQCNLGCGFCAYDRGLKFPRLQADAAQVRRVAQLLMQWSQMRGERLLLSWLGGEPLLVPWLLRLSEDLRRSADKCCLGSTPRINKCCLGSTPRINKCCLGSTPRINKCCLGSTSRINKCCLGSTSRINKSSLELALSLTTNGTRLSDVRVRQALLANFAEITVSIDAWGRAHEQLRGWTDGFHTLTQSMQQLFHERVISGSNMRVRINVVLMRNTIADFPALCDALSQWPISEISFNALGGRDRPEFYAKNALSAQDLEMFARALPVLRAQLAAKNIRLVGDENYLNRLKQIANRWAMPVRDCQPGQRFLFIDERGRMAPCHFSSDEYGLPLDALQSAHDLDQALASFAVQQAQRPASACADCMSTQVFGKFKPLLAIPFPTLLETSA